MSSNMATTRLCQLKQLYPGLLLRWGHGLELIHKPKTWGRSDLLFLDVGLLLLQLLLWLLLLQLLLHCLPPWWLGSWPVRFWRHGLGSRGFAATGRRWRNWPKWPNWCCGNGPNCLGWRWTCWSRRYGFATQKFDASLWPNFPPQVSGPVQALLEVILGPGPHLSSRRKGSESGFAGSLATLSDQQVVEWVNWGNWINWKHYKRINWGNLIGANVDG